jgi:hypothetical protein
MSRNSRGRDPYWTTAKFDSTDANGNPVKKGDKIWYYPDSRTVMTGPGAEKAAAEFEGSKQDEAFMSGNTW